MSGRDGISLSEIDRKRREKKRANGRARRSRSEGSQRRSKSAASRYRQRIDEKIFGKKSDTARQRFEQRLRDAKNPAEFERIFREHVKGNGMPPNMSSLIMLLDLAEEQNLLRVLEALSSAAKSAPPEQRNLLRGRLRNLEMSTSFDELADATTDLLGRL